MIYCYLCNLPIKARDEVERHHTIHKSRGGAQTAPTHKRCHRAHHSQQGDFRAWGKMSAQTRAWSFNLKNVRNHPAHNLDRAFYLMNYAH